ncbi:unnamed protein product [Didymodactylos carnosus]|uniref:Tubulin binding cofactor C-like domain-containing protein n=1 Tax=Didymodactylos carnosus TaxID=1234261 RepID=A0A813R0R2_9BILA|nr:unnamed protein product [Didymodactylos carnosus]CAF0886693.1 unnamed protein product [Didymodactylos carnosus]CAF3558872.1 unnamed protein product [Didymodactylos carnosus]CAF3669574.1 unnamed protein product [Didymodactylos carnosus]
MDAPDLTQSQSKLPSDDHNYYLLVSWTNNEIRYIITVAIRHQCRSSSSYILTPTRPLVQLNCSNLLFAPYNTFYIKLPEHGENRIM